MMNFLKKKFAKIHEKIIFQQHKVGNFVMMWHTLIVKEPSA